MDSHLRIKKFSHYEGSFCFCLGETLSKLEDDPDKRLISSCVDKVIIPKLSGLVSTGYDPLSTSQTNKLVGE